ncbi:uncharacterized protein DMAD_13763 [Drosophila madeirensis]
MVGVGWISYRRKAELEAFAKEFGLEREGTVEELRGRMSAFVSRGGHSATIQARLEELEDTFGRARTPDTKPETQQRSRSLSPTTSGHGTQTKEVPQEEPTRPSMHYLSIPVPGQQQRVSRTNERVILPNQRDVSGASGVQRVQRWGVTFDGASDPLRFIERLEERAVVVCIYIEYLLYQEYLK